MLLDEALRGLQVRGDGRYVDCTYGRGGHSRAIVACLGAHGRLLALDRDPAAVGHAREQLGGDARCAVETCCFSALDAVVARHGWSGQVDGVLFDLGVSSAQLQDAARGFSFQRNGALDMRMDPRQGMSAAQWLAGVREAELARVLHDYGEERYARRIARAIIHTRQRRPIDTTLALAAVIGAAVPPARRRGHHPATRSFQAIRIHVNRELGELADGLAQVPGVLAVGGRLAAIAFHSLEDRVVKRFLRAHARGEPGDGPRLRPLGRPRRPAAAETAANPRARSAVLRIAERVQ